MSDKSVPCGACSACCRVPTFFVDLHPEAGDKIETYQIDLGVVGKAGNFVFLLAKKPNGECVYLADGKCSIYERRPAACREFDCRDYYRLHDRRFRNAARKNTKGIEPVLRAARGLLGKDHAAA